MFSNLQLPSTAAAAATVMFLRSLLSYYLPPELRHFLPTKLLRFFSTLSNETTLLIDEFSGLNRNNLFSAAELYVAAVAAAASTTSAHTYRVSLPPKEKKIAVSFCSSEEIVDNFAGIQLKWRLITNQVQSQQIRDSGNNSPSAAVSEVRNFRLSFENKHRSRIIDEYLPYVLESSVALKREKKTPKLHTLDLSGSYRWKSVNLDHPAKFETLAMDDELKKTIVDDLDRFVRRRELYRRAGKAWKRGYLLFGPPGTGKSSLIAAMANYLNFDVYDLEATAIRCNSNLRHLLLSTANRSILVVEDIDASIDLSDRKKPHPSLMMEYDYIYSNQSPKVTLSGFLNFIDGLWSSTGDERIIIFTTNHKEKLDPALLRPGRMDLHVHMSYCTPCGFRLLANNYLGIKEHPLIFKAEELIASSKVTPAEIGEQLLKNDDPDLALEELIKFLDGKRRDNESLELKKISEFDDDGLTELMNIAKDLPVKTRQEILGTSEAAYALHILTRLLKQDVARVNANSFDSTGMMHEFGRENGVLTPLLPQEVPRVNANSSDSTRMSEFGRDNGILTRLGKTMGFVPQEVPSVNANSQIVRGCWNMGEDGILTPLLPQEAPRVNADSSDSTRVLTRLQTEEVPRVNADSSDSTRVLTRLQPEEVPRVNADSSDSTRVLTRLQPEEVPRVNADSSDSMRILEFGKEDGVDIPRLQ